MRKLVEDGGCAFGATQKGDYLLITVIITKIIDNNEIFKEHNYYDQLLFYNA